MSGDCVRVREWVSAEVDSELSDFELVLLTDHVAHCASCGAFRADVARIVGKLRATPLEPFERRILIKRPPRLRIRLVPAVAALAVTAVGLGSILATAGIRPGTQPTVGPVRSGQEQVQTGPLANPDAVNLGMMGGLERLAAAARTRTPAPPTRHGGLTIE